MKFLFLLTCLISVEPLALANVQGLIEPPTDVTLGDIALTVRLDYVERIVVPNQVELYLPFTVFECGFTQQTGYFYFVRWYANNVLLVTLGPTKNVTELLLMDDIITDNNVALGVYLKCGVSVSVDYFGFRTSMNFSDSFFAGIMFNNLSIYVPKTGTGTITFKTTLPIGCEYNRIHPEQSSCSLDLHMFERNYTCGSEPQTLYSLTGSIQRRCGIQIKTLRKDELWNPEQKYNITIVTKHENYNDESTFIQEFITENKRTNKLWSNYRPDSITVIVTDKDAYRNNYCSLVEGPHMTTPDGNRYQQQESGYFRLYRNTQYNIEVQTRTEQCNDNGAICTCAVLVRAGADIVIFETCSDQVQFIGYKAYGDCGILRFNRFSDNLYQVDTPIGTYIRVYLYTSGLMNVEIHMSPKDFVHTEGLCGFYDDNPSNDFIARNNFNLENNANHLFSRSWQLQDNENYFSFDYSQLTHWSEENQIYCFCKEDIGATLNTMKTTCSAKLTENCKVTSSHVTSSHVTSSHVTSSPVTSSPVTSLHVVTERFCPMMKTVYCKINGSCYAEGDTDIDNSCNMCQPSVFNTSWTSACRKPVDKEATPSSIVIIIGVVVGVLVCVGVIAAVCCIVMKAKSKPTIVQTSDVDNPNNHVYADLQTSRSDVTFYNSIVQTSDVDNSNNHEYDSLQTSRSDVTFSNSIVQTPDVDNSNSHVYDSLQTNRSDVTFANSVVQTSDVDNSNDHVYDSLQTSRSDVTLSNSAQPRVNNRADSAIPRRSQSDIDFVLTVQDD